MRTLGLLLLVVGCTADVTITTPRPEIPVGEGDGSGGSGEQTSITPTSYLEQIAKIQCDQAYHCRDSFPADAGYVFEDVWSTSPEACVQSLLAQWQPMQIETEIAKDRIRFDGAAALACLSGVTFAACTDYWSRGIEWAEPCYHVVIGMVPNGGTCEIDYDCKSYYCDTIDHRCY